MAVIINDFGMPSNCENCNMFDGECCCITMTECEDEKSYRNEDCPLKEVPTGKWISVNERLPEDSGYYLVSGGGRVWICECMNLMGIKGWVNNAKNPNVIAWQPLPKPYVLEEQQGEN